MDMDWLEYSLVSKLRDNLAMTSSFKINFFLTPLRIAKSLGVGMTHGIRDIESMLKKT